MPAKRDIISKVLFPWLLVLMLIGHAFLVNTGWKYVEEKKPYQVVPTLNLEWMKLISLDQERFVSLSFRSTFSLQPLPSVMSGTIGDCCPTCA